MNLLRISLRSNLLYELFYEEHWKFTNKDIFQPEITAF